MTIGTIDLVALAEQEDAVRRELAALIERQMEERKPFFNKLKEIDAIWPKRQQVWYDFDTGCPCDIENVRVAVPRKGGSDAPR